MFVKERCGAGYFILCNRERKDLSEIGGVFFFHMPCAPACRRCAEHRACVSRNFTGRHVRGSGRPAGEVDENATVLARELPFLRVLLESVSTLGSQQLARHTKWHVSGTARRLAIDWSV